jgi:hypothetical protein
VLHCSNLSIHSRNTAFHVNFSIPSKSLHEMSEVQKPSRIIVFSGNASHNRGDKSQTVPSPASKVDGGSVSSRSSTWQNAYSVESRDTLENGDHQSFALNRDTCPLGNCFIRSKPNRIATGTAIKPRFIRGSNVRSCQVLCSWTRSIRSKAEHKSTRCSLRASEKRSDPQRRRRGRNPGGLVNLQ